MANINEWFKGLSVFLLGSMFFYFAWDNLISGILDYVVGINIYLGSVAWVSFICLYVFVCPVYLFYTLMAGARNDVKTQPIYLLSGVGIWFIALISIVVLFYVFSGVNGDDGMIGLLDSSTDDLIDSTTEINRISWLGVLVGMLGIISIPAVFILKAYGLISMVGGKEDG